MAETRRDRARAAQSARADRRRRGAAFRHLDATTHHPGGDVGAVPWYGDVVRVADRASTGRWDKSAEAPGLGIEVDEAVIDAHPFQPDILHTTRRRDADGTVVDW